MLVYLVIVAQLIYGSGWVVQPVKPQATGNRTIIRHSLPQKRLVRKFGSNMNGTCTSIIDDNIVTCNGTSVLNDGKIPVLNEVNQSSSWASELFTLNVTTRSVVSFELDNKNHDRIQLAILNCPKLGIGLSSVNVYFNDSFRPGRNDRSLGNPTYSFLLPTSNMSCDHLLVFCLPYNTSLLPTRFIDLEFPSQQNNLSYIFLGEVKFLDGGSEPCDLNMPSAEYYIKSIEGDIFMNTASLQVGNGKPFFGPTVTTTTQSTNDSRTTIQPNLNDRTGSPNTIIVSSVVVTVLLITVVIAVAIILVLAMHLRKHKQKHEVRQLQNIVMETKEDEKEAESYMGNNYDIIDKPPQNGVKTATESVAITDALYSNPDEAVANDTYSHLRDSQKKKSTPADTAMISNEYSKLNRCQTDPIIQKSKCSPTPQKPTVEGMMYAVPDKKKKKKKASNKAPAIPDKSSELAEYLDTKEAGIVTSSDADLLEYSEVGAGNRLNSSTGPVPLSNSTARTYVSNLDSNPIYHPTDIAPTQAATVAASHVYDGVLDPDAIYSEPLPPNEHEPEWDPDQNIYEAVYSEPLKPSLFMQEREEVDTEDLHPYTSIYTTPIIPTTEKPLSVSYMNIKEIRSLGNGNFGEVVLAQTFGLMPSQLRLEGSAQYTLVAVKKLKENASEKNQQLFEKEVKFMSRLDHPNVIRLLGVCMDEAAPFIMMEYMSNGDLNQYLQRFQMQAAGSELYSNVKLVETSTLIYMSTQIASAMQYLASQNFIHRDLATRNCLVGSKDTIKVSDFGMSRSLYESQYYVVSGHAILPIRWMATECFYGKFSAKTDVWAFGVTMWEIFMLCSEQPYYQFQDRDVVEDAIRGPDRALLERPRKCPEDIYDIMKKCWIYDASHRPTFDELYALLSQMNQ